MFTSLNARALGLSLDAGETITLAAREGFGGVDLLVRDVVERGDDPALLRRKMDDLGLVGGAWPLPVSWRDGRETFERDLANLPRLAGVAATLGLSRTGTWVLPALPVYGSSVEDQYAAAVRLHVERLTAIANVLAVEGIRLGLEVIGVESSRQGLGEPFVHRLADLDRVLDGLWDLVPNLGILLDGFHLYAAGETLEQGLAWGVGRIVWVHVADLPATSSPARSAILDHERGLPGEHPAVGTAALLAGLHANGYEGPVTAEPWGNCRQFRGQDPSRVVAITAAALRSVWPSTR